MRRSSRPKRVKVQGKRSVSSTAGIPPQAKVHAKRLAAKKTPKREGSEVRELEKRLAEALKERSEALKQQAATSEILRIISASPTDVRPVLDAVAERAMKLCEAELSIVSRVDGREIRLGAVRGTSAEGTQAVVAAHPMSIDTETLSGRTIRTRKVQHVPDVFADPLYAQKEVAKIAGWSAGLGVPMLRKSTVIGAIFVGRRDPGRFSDSQVALLKTFADQAGVAIENVRLFNEVQARTRELSESLQQQTGAADVLKVISRSAFDLQTVLDTLTESACTLCDAEGGTMWRPDGEGFKVAAMFGYAVEVRSVLKRYVMKPSRDTCVGRTLLDGKTVYIRDVQADPEYHAPDVLAVRGSRAMIGVPLLREGAPIGVLALSRTVARPFTEQQIALATTFADQAVIAIENVRLFNETQEALERQTATAEVLKVISESPTDVQPVFEAVAKRAGLLCRADGSRVWRVLDGELRTMTRYERKHSADFAESLPLRRSSVVGRAFLEQRFIHIDDIVPLIPTEYPDIAGLQKRHEFRTVLMVPLLREGEALGAISLVRNEVQPFTPAEIALVQTFADQAVIAIENVRLFNETKEALEQQTATSEILRAISSSPTRLEPVLNAVVSAAARFCGAPDVVILRVDGGVLRGGAAVGQFAEIVREREGSISALEIPISRGSISGRSVSDRRTVHVHDLASENESEYPIGRQLQHRFGHRTCLATPLLREGVPLGAICLFRMEVNPFSEKQIELLRTFADQAVIAIENVRLFTELEARTLQLTRSVGELKALGEVGQAVSSTLDLETVLSTIVSRATALAGVDAGAIYEYDETRGEFYLQTADRLQDEMVTALRAGPIRKGEGALGRMAVAGEPAQIRDITTDASYQSRLREVVLRLGYRSLMAVPLMRDNHMLGGLVVYRKSPGEFDAAVIDLLRTFATQSALAIQNARLFREIELKSRELETASHHKSEFLANMSHELRTPLNAIIGFSEVLSERMFGEINEKQAEYIGDILQSGQHLLSLINDILDLSKIEAGRMELELSDVDLSSTIENTLILVRERAQRRGITLARTIDDQLGVVRADERKVKQVLLNLLSNALKFTPEGGRIDVQGAAHGGSAELSVTDTGVGIAPEDQKTIFEEFRQVGTAYKKVEGTGLGLAISRKFIELHGGKIWVTSKVGSGSTFSFTLPLQRLTPE